MLKVLQKVETVITLPFFLLSWFLCSVFYALRAGFDLAKADGTDKSAVLDKMFGKKEKND